MATRTSIEALKCLANVQVIMPSMRVLFSEYPKLPTLVTALQLPNHSLGSAFLLLRLLFFATATKTALGDGFVRDGVLDTLAEARYIVFLVNNLLQSHSLFLDYSKMQI